MGLCSSEPTDGDGKRFKALARDETGKLRVKIDTREKGLPISTVRNNDGTPAKVPPDKAAMNGKPVVEVQPQGQSQQQQEFKLPNAIPTATTRHEVASV